MAFIFLDYIFGAFLVTFAYFLKQKKSPTLPVPPGPQGLPIIGNALQIPKERTWLVYADWAKKYGDLTHLTAFGQHLIIVNTRSAARELLEKRNASYSGRVHMTFAGELIGWKKSVAMVEGPRHTQTRRMAQPFMSLSSVRAQYGDGMTCEAHRLLQNLLDCPDKWMEHYRSSAGAFIMLTTYGTQPGKERDALVDEAKSVVYHFSVAATPGNWMVDFLPFLKHVPSWVPGFGFNATAKTWHDELEHLVNSPFDRVKTLMSRHRMTPCIASRLLENNPDFESEMLIRWLCGSLFAAGADTTVGALACFTLAMTNFPAAQRIAQTELDAIVGRDRLPAFHDLDHAPYVHALVKEVLRWGIIVPMGFPHRLAAQEDDVYQGWRIPANTLLMPNSWAIPVFGFGGRVCLGQHVAYATLLIQIASILATFDICGVIGKDGKQIAPGNVGFSTGVVTHPDPFQTVLRPRSREAMELIQAANAFE
ncbi:cytochrome P450 [Dacryopinax primogenitus]|uniref:Cytochrome P450 n=1 Tax=Dacryopinax primogenitus (strain DJM 731) TaxID=1858805 RepID=M5G5M2_DACPD|nr:cytochrome P450 [Dacryopinax primogenitus]EJU01102.1 cytochrome P450 [Dacryopinax primogenitus]